jgi:hypothetical protein
MRPIKEIFTYLLFTLPFLIYSQDYELPHDSLIKKHRIRKIKVVNFQCDTALKAINKGYLNDIYYFNKKSQLIKQKRKFVTYYYKYNAAGQLISRQAKWKIFTHAWWEDGKFKCNTFHKIANSNKTVINEFVGKCRSCDSTKKTLKSMIFYSDQNGRDTLQVTTENNWYYTVPSDTGRIRYFYKKINNSTIELTTFNYFKNAVKKSEVTIIKINDKNQTVETYDPSHKSLCPRFVFEYKGDLLKKKLHFNCLSEPNDFDLYKYYFRLKPLK